MRSRKTFTCLAALISVALLATTAACGSSGNSSNAGGSGSADKPTIRIGYFPDISPVSLMKSEKLLETQGYKVEWTAFLKGVSQEAAAMVGGSIDVIWANTSAAVATFSKDPDLAYLVGQSITNDNLVVVPKDSKINSVADLKGQNVTTTGATTAPQLVLDLAMTAAGVDPKDAHYLQSPGPQQVPAMQQNAVVAAATYLPFGAQMALNGALRGSG